MTRLGHLRVRQPPRTGNRRLIIVLAFPHRSCRAPALRPKIVSPQDTMLTLVTSSMSTRILSTFCNAHWHLSPILRMSLSCPHRAIFDRVISYLYFCPHSPLFLAIASPNHILTGAKPQLILVPVYVSFSCFLLLGSSLLPWTVPRTMQSLGLFNNRY
ncbi:hypothetical protein EDB83DRAFT_472107 [Lactarius deliciosus]|nr:hypothetical protein EDB83DRAFT_472107 [Lactarius deliciosus]